MISLVGGKLTAIGEIQPYDGQPISTGLYYVVTDNDMPFQGNDFYTDNIVQNAFDAELINLLTLNTKSEHHQN